VTRSRILATAAAIVAAAVAGCGLGPGKDVGDVDLTVTRDYGVNVLVHKTDSIHESDTVLRVLDRSADISTRYGGGFVQSIDGLSGSQSGGRSSDWFFYVNGIESPIGAAQYDLSGGDRIWWDYRDWTAAMRVPAVVGSWPEPFAHGFEGQHWTTHPVCLIGGGVCDMVVQRLEAAGIRSPGFGPNSIKVLIGPWSAIRGEAPADLLAEGPDRSGVFARFVGTKKPLLDLLDTQGQPAGSIGKGGGLIAALRVGDGPPTWLVTGTDAKGVSAAAGLLGDALRNHYAVATQPGAGAIGVPVQ
jgi:Domain of unknown function (DUF4430)